MNHGSLFSGIGGFDLAASWLDWENVFHCEIDPFCQKILKYHFPNSQSYENIKTTDFSVWQGEIDVLSGGFPCQGFSQAGKRKGTADDRYLWPEMLRAIQQIKPRWILGENVLGIVNWNRGLVFEQVCSDMEAEGYSVQPYILPACGINAPHQRYRTWFVAHRNDDQRISSDTFNQWDWNSTFTDGSPFSYSYMHNGETAEYGSPEEKTTEKERIWKVYGSPWESCRTDAIVGDGRHPDRHGSHLGERNIDIGYSNGNGIGQKPRTSERQNPESGGICGDGSPGINSNSHCTGLQEKGAKQSATGPAGEGGEWTSTDTELGRGAQVELQIQSEQSNGIKPHGNGFERYAPNPRFKAGNELQTFTGGTQPFTGQIRSEHHENPCFSSSESEVLWTFTDCHGVGSQSTEQEREMERARSGEHGCGKDWQDFPTQSPVRGRNDGFSPPLDGITISKWRAESIKSYGNAIVPQLAYRLFRVMEMMSR